MSTSSPQPMTVLSALGLTVLASAVMVPSLHVSAALAAAIQGLSHAEALKQMSAGPLSLCGATVVGVGVALAIGKARFEPEASWSRALGLRAVPWRPTAMALTAGLAFQFPLSELENLMEMVIPTSVEQKLQVQRLMSAEGWHGFSLILVCLAAVVPLCEELLFRGFLLRGLRRRYGAASAVGLSSILFGLSHFRLPVAILPATMAGVLLGAVALRTRSTAPAIALHAGVNAVPVLLPVSLVSIPGFNTVQERVYHVPVPLLLGTCFVATALLALLWAQADRDARGF